jgi:hypothetical protein
MPFKDPQRRREYAREYARHLYRMQPEKMRNKAREDSRVFRAKLKSEFLLEYGGRCYCCGESEPVFLTVAHLDDSGAQHRKEVKGTSSVLLDLKRKGWPKDVIGILCMNCQFSTTMGRTCPHVQ